MTITRLAGAVGLVLGLAAVAAPAVAAAVPSSAPVTVAIIAGSRWT